ncbi:LEM domain-containing protein 1 isoform X1 [Mesocricetus auratus]|uniref:LEM domain-containing protein 1 isoform X1 n=1 Tax=Mesocricetus auratus TaxID=10036 RepID=A0ABM2X222_MESAU|nr:LEM domain-containing protein 1 isoform X1 [Mesocricetus auratus]
MVDVKCLSDNELRKQLKKLGFSPGPIIPSTRKAYEKKLVQLLVSPPCELPAMRRLKKLHGCEDSDDNEDPRVNIILKGNIKFSKDRAKECKRFPAWKILQIHLALSLSCKSLHGRPAEWCLETKTEKPDNEMKWQQADMGKSNSECKNWKMLVKRPEASTSNRRILDIYYLRQKPAKGVRYAARPIPRISHGCATRKDYCQENQSLQSSFLSQNPGNSFPWSLKLAILGIFIIVLFVYITVEKKPLMS